MVTGIHESTACRIVRPVSVALEGKLHEYVSFPRQERALRALKIGFHDIAGFPNVVGAVDGTHIRLQGPSRPNQEFVYVNRKGYHSLNIQVICDHQMKFTNCVIRWPGSTHDSRIFAESTINRAFRDAQIDGYLIADKGYALGPFLLTPYLAPGNAQERRYNRIHASTRCIVERTIGAWKRRFRAMHEEN